MNPHSDILELVPEDELQRERIISELRSRATSAVKNSFMEQAGWLYNRVITLLEEADKRDEEALSIAYSNRAHVSLVTNKLESAQKDASRALKLNNSNEKACFRYGRACRKLNQYEKALREYNEYQENIKESRDIQAEIDDCLEEWEKFQNEQRELKEMGQVKAPTTIAPCKPMAPKEEVKPPKSSSIKKEDEFRGYKKLDDGTVTSYFHRELDQEAKELIGSCAPKKLESVENATLASSKGSAWNHAGTFEERDVTEIIKAAYKAKIKVPKSTSARAEGEASIIVSRGKTKYFMDMSFTISFPDNTSLKFLDIGCEKPEDTDIEWDGSWGTAAERGQAVKDSRRLLSSFYEDYTKGALTEQ